MAWRRAAVLGVAAIAATGTALLAAPSTTVGAATPIPPFTQCPAVGLDTSCAILIVIQPDGSLTILRDATQRPIDGSEDTLIGVQNNSAITVPSIAIGSATLAVFGFEGDGVCTFTFIGDAYCTATPPPATGYEGPDTTFSQISANKRRGTVNFTDAGGGLPSNGTTFFSLEGALTATTLITGAATSLAFTSTSATTTDVADPTTVSATLTAATVPVPGATVTFTLGTGSGADTCTGTTNSSGVASCPITPTQPAGPYQLTSSFAGSSVPFLAGVANSAPFTVTLEQDGLTYTGALAVVVGQPLPLSGLLTTDDPAAGTPLGGKTVRLTLGSGTNAQTCLGLTIPSGVAACIIASVRQSPGSVGASASFAGDASYVAAAAAGAVTVTAAAGAPVPPPHPGVGTPDTGGAGDPPVVLASMLMVAGGAVTAAAGRARRRLR